MADIFIKKKDEVYVIILAEDHIIKEMQTHFEFYIPGYQFMPTYRARLWDGKIRLLSYKTREIYLGLIPHIESFASDRNYTIEYDENLDIHSNEFSEVEANTFIDSLSLPFPVREHQLKAFVYSIRNKRAVLLSPTASGKSLIIYLLCRYYANKKTLIIVPTTSLVSQLYTDFNEYGKNDNWKSDNHVHYIMSGRDKNSDRTIYISTWQSIYNQPKSYFEQFDIVIADEAHQYKAKSLISIMTKLTQTKLRFGLTGTLDNSDTHALVLEGLFGKIKKVVSTKELIEKNHLSPLKIKAIVLKYPNDVCSSNRGKKYQDEIDFLISSFQRNAFIQNLAISLKGNTLLLFNYVEKHGKVLNELISSKIQNSNRKVFYVYGGTEVEDREEIRRIVENENDAIIIASSGVYSTGVNIKNLSNIIFSHPGKSKIRVLQSIGRVLRTSIAKENATLYDIVDDLSIKSYQNYAVKHFIERHKYYTEEKFPVKIYKVELKNESQS